MWSKQTTGPRNRCFECCRPLLPKIIGVAATSAARRITLTVQCAALLLPGPHRIDHAHGYNSDYYRSEHRHFNCPRSTRCLSVGLVNLLVERRPPKPELKRLESMQYRFKARRYPCQKPSQRRRRKIPSDGRPIDGSLNARSRSAVAYTASQQEGTSPPLARW